jgi:hypothetical protein
MGLEEIKSTDKKGERIKAHFHIEKEIVISG